MVKQWLNEYCSGLSGTLRQTARLRQLRMNGFERWHVKEIVNILPVLLQIAATLFFGGLLVLLWTLDPTVAMVASALVGLLAAFSLFTIVLPSITTHCAYLSPPSLAVYALSRPFRTPIYGIVHTLAYRLARFFRVPIRKRSSGEKGVSDAYEIWIRVPWRRSWTLIYATQHMNDAGLEWRGRETALLSRWRQKLDADMIASAYTAAMDTSYLQVATTCMTELGCNAMTRCFEAIRSANIAHWGNGSGHVLSMGQFAHPCTWSTAILAHMTVRKNDVTFKMRRAQVSAALDTAYQYFSHSAPQVEWDAPLTRLALADLASIVRHYDLRKLPQHYFHIGGSLLETQLQWLMEGAAGKNIGNDLRQYSKCRTVSF